MVLTVISAFRLWRDEQALVTNCHPGAMTNIIALLYIPFTLIKILLTILNIVP